MNILVLTYLVVEQLSKFLHFTNIDWRVLIFDTAIFSFSFRERVIPAIVTYLEPTWRRQFDCRARRRRCRGLRGRCASKFQSSLPPPLYKKYFIYLFWLYADSASQWTVDENFAIGSIFGAGIEHFNRRSWGMVMFICRQCQWMQSWIIKTKLRPDLNQIRQIFSFIKSFQFPQIWCRYQKQILE